MKFDINKVTKVKDKAEKLFNKGRLKDAINLYMDIWPCGYEDPRIFMRIGDIARKDGNTTEAIKAYKEAVDVFTKLGFIIKAIAVCKIITQLDPSEDAIHDRLADLYSASNKPAEAGGKPAETTEARTTTAGDRPATAGDSGEHIAAPPEDIKTKETSGTAAFHPTKATKKREFPRTPLFSDFDREELFAVVRKVLFHTFDSGTEVIKAGDKGNSIFIIVTGLLAVMGETETGSEKTIATLDRDGAFFGEFAFFSNSRRKNTVKTLEETELLEITKADLDEIIKKHPNVSRVLFDFYKERVVDSLMATSQIFSCMTLEDRKEILNRLSLKSFKKGDKIVTQGESGNEMFLIKEGVVEVWLTKADATRKTIGELVEGDFFGEVSLATNKPRVANVSATGNVTVVIFSRPVLKEILGKYPEVKHILEGIIKERVTSTMKVKKDNSPLL